MSNNKNNVMQVLIARGADVNAKDGTGDTALMEASFHGYHDVVQLLLAKGADANATDSMGRNALLRACERGGHLDVVQLLIAKGADVNAKNNRGQTPPSHAKNAEVKALLVKAGARND